MPSPEQRTGSGLRGNLPGELTSFVGRQPELTQVTSALSTTRLLTLVGPGGVGKTRLAIRVAEKVRRAFPDGSWLVDLSALRDPTLLAEHVAATLDLRDDSGRWLVATLSDYLSQRRLLLILDNCEHLLDACAALVRAMLRDGSELRILATSREPLGLTAESLMHVAPLEIGGPALQLLADRASAVRPEFELTDASRPLALELCRRLDGIPLAIELAAARLRGMALDEVVSRLDDRFALLTTGDRAGPARQQTLQAALDWSYELLAPDERFLWRRLAAFAGTFDASAVRAICADEGGLSEDRVADGLARLVERSIVQLDDAVVGRYRLLETIREYATEQAADSGELEWLRIRHRDHYLDLARQAARTWATGEQGAWFRRLSDDYDNLRQAFEHCRETPEAAAAGLDVAARLWIGWQVIGRVGEGRRWVSALLAAAPPDAASRPMGLWAAGYLALAQHDTEAAEPSLDEALALSRQVGDEEAESYAIGHLGLLRLFAGSYQEARALFAESAQRHQREGRPGLAAFQLADAAIAATLDGDTESAIPEFEESLVTARRVGDHWTESHALWGLGIAWWTRGEWEEAEASMRQSLGLMRDVGDRGGVALCLEGLALVASASGDAEFSAWLLGAADTAWDAIPAPPPGTATALRERQLGATRAALGERRFAQAVAAGRASDPALAVARALGEAEAAPAAAEPGRLTAREREVALLVAQGLTNRDIAGRLVLSPRTIESHVERIMNRLGVGSRTEIAAWAASHLDSTERGEIP
jgi:predicted ATPase/DNA-binding CsgD family transcriptional regulator